MKSVLSKIVLIPLLIISGLLIISCGICFFLSFTPAFAYDSFGVRLMSLFTYAVLTFAFYRLFRLLLRLKKSGSTKKTEAVPAERDSESNKDNKSAGTADVKPASTSDVKSAGTSDVKPAGTSDVKPAGTSDVKSAGTSDVKPAGTSDVKPATDYYSVPDLKDTSFIDSMCNKKPPLKLGDSSYSIRIDFDGQKYCVRCSYELMDWGTGNRSGRIHGGGSFIGENPAVVYAQIEDAFKGAYGIPASWKKPIRDYLGIGG